MMKRIILYIIIPVCFCITSVALRVSATEQGPYASFYYGAKGSGFLFLPKPEGDGADSTKPVEGQSFSSAKKYSLEGGYYYDFVQADIGYRRSDIDYQKSDFLPKTQQSSGDSSALTLRIGRRYSIPGDTSYTWLYLGLRRYEFTSSSSSLDAKGYGYIVGYSGFYSFGLYHAVECVIKLDAWLGTYRLQSLHSSLPVNDISKRYSLCTGGGIGGGLQYEPYNITMLLKFSSDYDRLSYRGYSGTSKRNFSVGGHSHCIGAEIIFSLPAVRYNENK